MDDAVKREVERRFDETCTHPSWVKFFSDDNPDDKLKLCVVTARMDIERDIRNGSRGLSEVEMRNVNIGILAWEILQRRGVIPRTGGKP